jgi:alanyl aminopeptidase
VGSPWQVPVCVAIGREDGSRSRQCLLLAGPEQEVELEATAGCPAWVHPNDGERGYYRWQMAPERLVALAGEHRDALDVAERVALPGHYQALLAAEALPVEDHFGALRQLAGDDRHQVVEAVVSALQFLRDAAIPDPESALGQAFARAVREMLEPQLARVGAEPRAGEPVAARLRRAAVLPALAEMGRDEAVLARAREIAVRFLEAPESVDEETLELLLPIAAGEGDADLWHALTAIALDPPSPGVRATVVRSLGAFADPELLERSLDLVVDGRLRAQDYRTLEGGIRPAQRGVAWRWVERRYQEIVAMLGPMTATRLPGTAAGLCSDEDASRVEAFFASAQGVPPGTERNLLLALEGISHCARMRASIQPGLNRVLLARERRAGE